MRRITESPGAAGESLARKKGISKMNIKLPPTKGRGKWGRKIRCRRRNRGRMHPHEACTRILIENRTNRSVRITVASNTVFGRKNAFGAIRQTFFSSPSLRKWFDRHDAVADAHIAMAERAEYERLCRESAAYRASKSGKKNERAV